MRLKKAHWIIIAIVMAIILGFFLGRGYIHRQLDAALKQEFKKALGKNIQVDFRRSIIGLSSETIGLKSIDIEASQNGSPYWNAHVEQFTIHGFDVFDFISSGNIGIDSIEIASPDFKLFQSKDTSMVSAADTTQREQKENELKIQAITLSSGKFLYDPKGALEVKADVSLRVTDFDLQKLDTFILNPWAQTEFHLQNFRMQYPDSVYNMEVQSVSVKPDSTSIQILGFEMHSNLSTTEFPRFFGWSKAMLDVDIESCEILKPEALDFDNLHLEKINANNADLSIHKDHQYPLPNRVTKLPQVALEALPFKIQIDSILFSQSSLEYTSIMKSGDEAELILSDVEASLTMLQNVDTALPAFKLQANSKLMAQASLQMEAIYSYGTNAPFSVKGIMGNTRLSFMGEYLQKFVGIKIADGVLNKLEFEMNGNDFGVGGFVDFYYDHLQIHVVDKESGEDKEFVNFLSNMVGGLLFWQENPSKEQFRRGSFYVERDVRKGFISMWIDGLVEGILKTVSKVDTTKFTNHSSEKKSKKKRKKKKNKA